MNPDSPIQPGPACRSFLRELELHASHREADYPVPHVGSCAFCAARLKAARATQDLLRAMPRPQPPAVLTSSLFVDHIHEAVVQDLETDDAPLRRALLSIEMPAGEADAVDPRSPQVSARVAAELRRTPADSVPARTWRSMGERLLGEISAQRRLSRAARRRAAIAALLVASVATAVALYDRPVAPGPEPEIVFERMANAPFVDVLPVSVLRSGGQK